MQLKKSTNYDVSGLGHGIVDLLGKVSEEGLKKTGLSKGRMTLVDSETIAKIKKAIEHVTWEKAIGGSALNTIRILSLLGLKTYYSTSVGNDEFGEFMIRELHKLKIDEDIAVLANLPTANLVSLVTPDAERTMATCLGAAEAFSMEHVKDFEKALNAKIFYFTGYKLTNKNNKEVMLESVKKAKAAGVIVAFDMADAIILQNFKAEYNEIIPYCDIIFMNKDEALSWGKTMDDAINSLRKTAKIIAAKKGKEGCIVYDCEKDESIKVSGFPVNAKDTTGAGDSFAAGFLFGIVKGFSLENCARLGNLVASRLIQNIGAQISKEQLEEVKNMITKIQNQKTQMEE